MAVQVIIEPVAADFGEQETAVFDAIEVTVRPLTAPMEGALLRSPE